MAVIVGLGNPGPEYTGTRHNAGFWLVDALVHALGGAFAPEGKFHGETALVRIANQPVRVLKPMTFMNRSGQAVRALAQFYKVEPGQVLVVHDDLDLEPGTVRLKLDGGHGGHNGLRDISAHIGAEFLRFRVGIGHPRNAKHESEVLDWVLKRPSADDEQAIRSAIDSAIEQIPRLFDDKGVERVMEILNRKQ